MTQDRLEQWSKEVLPFLKKHRECQINRVEDATEWGNYIDRYKRELEVLHQIEALIKEREDT